MQHLKQSPKDVKNLFKHKKLKYILAWDIFISDF